MSVRASGALITVSSILFSLPMELLGFLAEDDPSFVYALGRAYEGRSRDEAALSVYGFVDKMGIAPWDGFAAVRGAAISLRRFDLPATLEWADRAIAAQPNNRDGWWYRGTALYRMEEYRQLQSFIESIPAASDLSYGFSADSVTFAADAAVWRAIVGLERSADPRPFVDAFVRIPAGPIHSRLFLYMLYRDRRFSMFSPDERLLLEAVYRTAIDELQEALRLFPMIETESIISWLDTAADTDRSVEELALPGLWGTLYSALAAERSDIPGWLARLSDLSADDNGRFDLLRTRPAGGLSADETGVLLERIFTTTDETPLRELALRRYIDDRIDSGDPLLAVIDDLVDAPVSNE